MKFDVIIGIETHLQLNTQTKMFCRCSTDWWQAEPNTHVCPVCLGLPGALPVMNKLALDKAMLMGLALQSTLADRAHFDRKNYFYPDLAKGYQISQYDQPLCLGGQVEVDGRMIGITRAHLEEDVGKLNHDGTDSLVDFNKAGTPLLEIVSEPVIISAAEAKAYVQTLRQIGRYIGINEGNLEQGQLRADVNISLQQPGKWRYDGGLQTTEGYVMNARVEVKNLNSFKAIERAVEYEIERQAAELEADQTIIQETRGWDEVKGKTTSQRGKEEAHDYRYFPEPDLPPLVIDQAWKDALMSQLPELPLAKKQRFMVDYGLNEYDARLLVEESATADWFEQAVEAVIASGCDQVKAAKTVANWVNGELARLQNDTQVQLIDSKILPAQLAVVLYLIDQSKISGSVAKEIVAEVYISGQDPQQLVTSRGLEQVSQASDLQPIVAQVLTDNPDAVANYKAGKQSSIMFLVGQVMKQTQGRAQPDAVKTMLEQLLS